MTAQKRAAEDLMRRAGLQGGPCGLEEFKKIQVFDPILCEISKN